MSRPVVWLHGDSLGPSDPALQAHPGAPAIFVFDDVVLDGYGLTLKRLQFLYECLLELPVTIRRGDVSREVLAFAHEHDADRVAVARTPAPRFAKLVAEIERALPVEVLDHPPFVVMDKQPSLRKFGYYWRQAKQDAFRKTGDERVTAPRLPRDVVTDRAALNVVLFKRDLRVADHAPLVEAAKRGPVLPLYIVEPALLHADDYDPMHWTFVRASLAELRERLSELGQGLVVRIGDPIEVLDRLATEHPIASLWAHEETGNLIAYARDRRLRRWSRDRGISFAELPKDGVVRRLPSRDDWDAIWEERMAQPVLAPPLKLPTLADIEPGPIPSHADLGLAVDIRTGAQPAGERRAQALLTSFLHDRGEDYTRAMSSPVTAPNACSRLSPHLTWGNISLRQVAHAMRARRAELRELTPADRGNWLRAMASFESRLHWRDHFIQKLEDDPAFEVENMVRAYDGLREGAFDRSLYDAWARGQTGFPMVDACMRRLLHTGWINFRMRAFLVSFASYNLWLHWREPGLHLARVFVDYEPGIHWPQHQMQAGTTGINTLRIYNPVKQGIDQDATGDFIREWVPELRPVPTSFIHQP